MENNLIDRETLGQFVDALLAQKYPGQPTEPLSEERERAMKALDDEIGLALFGKLDDDKLQEINQIMDGGADESAIDTFFKNAGIEPEKEVAAAMQAFAADYLGGQNE